MGQQQKSKRSYKTNSIADIARTINGRAFRRFGFAKSDIHLHWHEIVGSTLAKSSLPERLVITKNIAKDDDNGQQRRAGVLHIRVEGSFAPEMQHLELLVIDKINGYYGFKAVERLVFNHGPVETKAAEKKYIKPILSDSQEKQLDHMLNQIKDDHLRASLYKVGAELIAVDKTTQTQQIKRFGRRGKGSAEVKKAD